MLNRTRGFCNSEDRLDSSLNPVPSSDGEGALVLRICAVRDLARGRDLNLVYSEARLALVAGMTCKNLEEIVLS